MANPHRGEVDLKIGDAAYKLAFGINEICEVEQVLDMPIVAILSQLQNPRRTPLHVIRALFWGGLRKHHGETTLEEAGHLIGHLGGGGPALELIGEGLKRSFPDAEEEADARPRKGARAGTGRRS